MCLRDTHCGGNGRSFMRTLIFLTPLHVTESTLTVLLNKDEDGGAGPLETISCSRTY